MCDFVDVVCFKQKTAYEMRISDWSSDVCSSDLFGPGWGYNDVSSYTVYTSGLKLEINRAADGSRLFEGHADAQSRDNNLQTIVPKLVEAMFTGFPGNSGERVRITVAPPEKG